MQSPRGLNLRWCFSWFLLTPPFSGCCWGAGDHCFCFFWGLGVFLGLMAIQVQNHQLLNNWRAIIMPLAQGYGSTLVTAQWASTTFLQHSVIFSTYCSSRSQKCKRGARTHLLKRHNYLCEINWLSLQRKVSSAKTQLKGLIFHERESKLRGLKPENHQIHLRGFMSIWNTY